FRVKENMSQKTIRKLARGLMYSGWAAQTVARNGWPRKLLFYGSGIGDDLLCTTVARELQNRRAGRIWVATKHLELFDGNPDTRAVLISDWKAGALGRLRGADVSPLWSTQYEPENDRDPEPPMHFAAMMCEKASITGYISIRPYLFLRHSEREQGKIAEN